MKNRMACIVPLFAVLLLTSASRATPLASPPVKSQPSKTQAPLEARSQGVEWEYLVVSFGKAYFAGPLTASGKSGSAKLRAFSEVGLFAQEATSIQGDLDKLGHYGWELVCAVGVIGGDQEFIMKRPFDATRSAKEAALVAEDARRLREEEAARAAQAMQDGLVDLDAVELEAKEQAARDALAARITDAISKLPATPPPAVTITTSGAPPIAQVTLSINYTAALLKEGGKYRASEARDLVRVLVLDLTEKAGLTQDILRADWSKGRVVIGVGVQIEYAGKQHTVYTQYPESYYIQ